MTAPHPLFLDASLEMTGKDAPALEGAALAPGTRVNITHLASEDLDTRIDAARAVGKHGLTPVPHLSARRLRSPAELGETLAALRSAQATESVFVVAGDPTTPHGPYPDALSVIRSGLLEEHGVRHVGITGYPEGHPAIGTPALWSALEEKTAALKEQSLTATVTTQFGFAVEPVLTWLEEARARGIDVPVRIGVPGPAGVRRLVAYARRFGVSTSTGIARKYGFSLTHLMGTAGPDRFLRALAADLVPERHGEVALHFYTFGGLEATSAWLTGAATAPLPARSPRSRASRTTAG
ncbi:methylenetetrahydrofolate reductase [Streptomyces acidiscabies]|uniref:Methylenetetrahydrofolate reductase n=1 Tax=Streptomyces acidiscabies TaxID=42234 RepID=A0AAP6BA86_9ACTN|nr:methylenetetrahydrofolate reductase [Streptomyces acidiscabies]MBP5935533.1 methylenetetrahydrofolate reductase [Streptomyces sp. LBUM 1476]MBZ3916592.1 methylenetetrahydrofolate reductase [Streptomyces acidiscabies]MDX2961033.1 methylenetetrahydrofolate reductase [Streptomyces acidiscabies]MDX3020270.1 methylenetetrahydrofolate reductase [Streptomyces acidiscabies]MDX3791740.1 methylenetetrahydrofolate reductase [Streptomyces acidiscabies]